MLYAFKCESCGRRRDPEVAYCAQCGSEDAKEDRDHPVAPGSRFVADLPEDGEPPEYMTDAGIRRRIGGLQENAIRLGRPTPDVESATPDAIALERSNRIASRRPDLSLPGAQSPDIQLGALTTPYIHTGLGNPAGLSGRITRGYRHWRHKR